jgi:maintenance of morphology protein 1
LHRWFDERAVEPRFQEIALPSLWPRKKNTRGPDDAMAEANASIGRSKGKEIGRDLREEARKEVAAEQETREQSSLRQRRRPIDEGGSVMPGSIPGLNLDLRQ